MNILKRKILLPLVLLTIVAVVMGVLNIYLKANDSTLIINIILIIVVLCIGIISILYSIKTI